MSVIIAILEVIWIILFLGFWISFYLTEYKNQKKAEGKMSEVEFKHELSFPLPDLGWITLTLVIAAIGLFLEQNFGYFFTALAGSGMMFLGLIDLAFNIQNEGFNREKRGFDAVISIGIVVLSLIFGLIFIIYGAIELGIF